MAVHLLRHNQTLAYLIYLPYHHCTRSSSSIHIALGSLNILTHGDQMPTTRI
jgi:hypothetical protein